MDRKSQHLHNAESASTVAAHHRDLSSIHERLAKLSMRKSMSDDDDDDDDNQAACHEDAAASHKALSAHFVKESAHHSRLAREDDEFGEPLTRAMGDRSDAIRPDGVFAVIGDIPENVRAVTRPGQPQIGLVDTSGVDPALVKFVRTDAIDR